ncbi:multidrug ABC transporter ATP-binding protein, partial [Paenibacillus sepulcri]|nr:multidrug ABC transporter ATP-binding protein [Paenibacillus sepulcri]
MKLFRSYLQFVKPYRWLVAFTLIIGIMKFAIPLTMPLFIKYVVDEILTATLPASEKLDKLARVIGLAFVLFVIVRYPIEYFRQYFAQFTTSRVLFDLRNKLYSHLQLLSIRFYQNRKSGEIISRVMNDAEQTKSLVETGLMNIWLDMFTLVIAVVIMFNMNVPLTFVAIAILPLYAYAVKKLYKRLQAYSRSRSQSLAEMQGYLNEHVNGIPVVKSFTLEAHEQEQFQVRNRSFLERAFALTRWNALTQSIT